MTEEALSRAWKRIEKISASFKGEQITLTPRQEKLLSILRDAPRTIGEIQKELGVGKSGAHFILKSVLESREPPYRLSPQVFSSLKGNLPALGALDFTRFVVFGGPIVRRINFQL